MSGSLRDRHRRGRESAQGQRRAAWLDPEGGERGAGTILALCGVVVLLVFGLAALALLGAQALRTRATSAADLAALAAASTSLSGADLACARAAEVAAANQARLVACRLTASDAWVQVRAPTPEVLRRLLRAPPGVGARAHAELVVVEEGR